MISGDSGSRRPAVIWVMCVYYVVLAGASIAGNSIVFSQRTVREGIGLVTRDPGILQYLAAFAFPALALIGAVLLFKMNESAVWVLGAVLAFSTINRLVQLLTFGTETIRGSLSSLLLDLGVEALMFFYAFRLRRQGALT